MLRVYLTSLIIGILTAGCASIPCYPPSYYDPLPDARKVSCPVLILHGDRDAHTPLENAHKYAEAMCSGGNKDVTVKILADHNHIFLEDRDGRKSGYLELVKHTNQLSEFLLNIITDWITSRLIP